MHKYLHNYEDFLLIEDDYVVRASSSIADGPKSRNRKGYSENGEDDDYDSYDDDYDFDEDDEYDDDEDRFERR